MIKSFPGPEKSVNLKDLQQGKGVAQKYRNRRIGDFLKELDLTEGRGTGIPKILRAMKKNGSPRPVFETDEARSYFWAILPIHPKTLKSKKGDAERQESRQESIDSRVLGLLSKDSLSKKEIAHLLGHGSIFGALNKAVSSLYNKGCIEYMIPEKPQSRLQKYRITEKGLKLP